ncbi:hypothetical protein StoSoilB3_34780 [Arthrobacter sp. StoSoilB3]|nr:hypothetical protein StoSoilB3_34780 [Arthrobacter sp. StoSoilB3]
MMIRTRKRVDSYWFALAACFGVAIGAATTIAMPWLLIVGGVSIFLPLIVGFSYGQFGPGVRDSKVSGSPAITVAAMAFSLIAMLLRDSPVVAWAGPVLGVASFAGMYLCLRRYGHFYVPVRSCCRAQEGMKLVTDDEGLQFARQPKQ